MENLIIKRVLIRTDGIKYVVIPKASKLNSGDYVVITKIKEGGLK
jgi:hypothetical protein